MGRNIYGFYRALHELFTQSGTLIIDSPNPNEINLQTINPIVCHIKRISKSFTDHAIDLFPHFLI